MRAPDLLWHADIITPSLLTPTVTVNCPPGELGGVGLVTLHTPHPRYPQTLPRTLSIFPAPSRLARPQPQAGLGAQARWDPPFSAPRRQPRPRPSALGPTRSTSRPEAPGRRFPALRPRPLPTPPRAGRLSLRLSVLPATSLSVSAAWDSGSSARPAPALGGSRGRGAAPGHVPGHAPPPARCASSRALASSGQPRWG